MHGWPELWYSWRLQLAALAAAGFRAVAPDMRGYGESEAPADIAAYSILHLVGDMVGLVAALGERRAIIVGHDWGANVAWTAAMLRPDLFRAVVAMSVPFRARGPRPPLEMLHQAGFDNFYMVLFPEARRRRGRVRSGYRGRHAAHDYSGRATGRIKSSSASWRQGKGSWPIPWHPDVAGVAAAARTSPTVAGEFKRRRISRRAELVPQHAAVVGIARAWRGCVIAQPSLFIAGARDDVLKFPRRQGTSRRARHRCFRGFEALTS